MVLNSLISGIGKIIKGISCVFQGLGKGLNWYSKELKLYLNENKPRNKSKNMFKRYRNGYNQ